MGRIWALDAHVPQCQGLGGIDLGNQQRNKCGQRRIADLIVYRFNRFQIRTDELIKIDFFLPITGVLFAHPDSNKG